MTDRLARTHIPMSSKRTVSERQHGVCKCGCGTPIFGTKGKIHWDHEPALRLRDIAPDGKDYIPRQNNPAYLDALCVTAHQAKTNGTGATTAGRDTGKIKKERKRNKPPKIKKRIASRPMASCGTFQKGKKMQSRPFQQRRNP